MNEIRTKPFMPPSTSERAADYRRNFVTDATIKTLAQIRKTNVDEIRREIRAPSAPLRAADFPGSSVVKLLLLAPKSTMAQLVPLATTVDLKGIAQFTFQMPTSYAAAAFVGEGQAAPFRQGAYQGFTIGPVHKLALLAALSSEMEAAAGDIATTMIAHTLEVMIGRGIDGQALSANAATADAPAGLLYGVTPVTPVAGGGVNAMLGDLRNLIGSIMTAGIDASSVVFVCAMPQALSLSMLAGPHFTQQIIASAALAAGTVVACAAAALVVAGEGTPVIDTSRAATLHMSDPASQIATGGVMAAPASSLYQQDLLALRCVSWITWAAAPGSIAVVNGATW